MKDYTEACARSGMSRAYYSVDVFPRRSTKPAELVKSPPVFRFTLPRLLFGWLANALSGARVD